MNQHPAPSPRFQEGFNTKIKSSIGVDHIPTSIICFKASGLGPKASRIPETYQGEKWDESWYISCLYQRSWSGSCRLAPSASTNEVVAATVVRRPSIVSRATANAIGVGRALGDACVWSASGPDRAVYEDGPGALIRPAFGLIVDAAPISRST